MIYMMEARAEICNTGSSLVGLQGDAKVSPFLYPMEVETDESKKNNF